MPTDRKGNEIVVVKLLASNPPYNAGEVAGFEPEYAEALIGMGKAERYTPEEGEKQPATKRPQIKPRGAANKQMEASEKEGYVTK